MAKVFIYFTVGFKILKKEISYLTLKPKCVTLIPMKKALLLSLLIVLLFDLQAQPKIGLTFSPSISSNRVKYKNDAATDISKNGAAFKLRLGLEIDFPIKNADTYFISTGLIFSPKRAGLTIDSVGGSYTEGYKLQYLQIPLTLKLYTNEIMPDVKTYFQLGFLGEVLVYDEPEGDDYSMVKKIKPYDTSFVFGIGAEYGASISSLIYAALIYNRGLVNIVSESPAAKDLNINLDMISLQIGIKF